MTSDNDRPQRVRWLCQITNPRPNCSFWHKNGQADSNNGFNPMLQDENDNVRFFFFQAIYFQKLRDRNMCDPVLRSYELYLHECQLPRRFIACDSNLANGIHCSPTAFLSRQFKKVTGNREVGSTVVDLHEAPARCGAVI